MLLSPISPRIQSRKITACLVLGSFLLSQISPLPQALATSAEPSSLRLDLQKFSLPESLGTLEEIYQGRPGPSIILIQDAHGIPEAQEKIKDLILYLEKKYGIRRVALEGASGPLDAVLIRNFPDKKTLDVVLKRYAEQGELSGSVWPLLVSPYESSYFGIENQDLYEQGLALFHQTKFESKVFNLLEKSELELTHLKKQYFPPELSTLTFLLNDWKRDPAKLPELLLRLNTIEPPAKDSKLSALIPELQNTTAILPEVRIVHQKVIQDLRSKNKKSGFLKTLNALQQDYQTTSGSLSEWAKILADTIHYENLPISLSREFVESAARQRSLMNLEGCELFQEIEAYAEKIIQQQIHKTLKDSLRPIVSELFSREKELALLRKIAKLELTRGEWEEIKTIDPRLKTQDQKKSAGISLQSSVFGLLSLHFAFYWNAEAREEAMAKNLALSEPRRAYRNSLSAKPTRPAGGRSTLPTILVAGGFHAQGLARHFQRAGISYALIRPSFSRLAETDLYQREMEGKVSWGKYLREEHGSFNLYQAFQEAIRDQLLEYSVEGKANTLKLWRDKILRSLGQHQHLDQASSYTSFIDMAPFDSGLAAKAELFLDRVRKLYQSRQLHEKNLLQAVRVAQINAPFSTYPFVRNLRLKTFLVPALARNELRSPVSFSSDEHKGQAIIEMKALLNERAKRRIKHGGTQNGFDRRNIPILGVGGLAEFDELKVFLQTVFGNRLPVVQTADPNHVTLDSSNELSRINDFLSRIQLGPSASPLLQEEDRRVLEESYQFFESVREVAREKQSILEIPPRGQEMQLELFLDRWENLSGRTEGTILDLLKYFQEASSPQSKNEIQQGLKKEVDSDFVDRYSTWLMELGLIQKLGDQYQLSSFAREVVQETGAAYTIYRPLRRKYFYQTYYRHARAVDRIMNRLYYNLTELIAPTAYEYQNLNDHLAIRKPIQGKAEFNRAVEIHNVGDKTPEEVLKERPQLIADIFYFSAQHQRPISPSLLSAIKSNRNQVPVKILRKVFKKILQMNASVTEVVRDMHETGILERILPSYQRLNGLYMDFDSDHRRSVDAHQLDVLDFIEWLPQAHEQSVFAPAAAVYHELEQSESAFVPLREYLRLTSLEHDSAKDILASFQNASHQIRGAEELTPEELKLLHYDKKLIYQVSWLTWHHQELNAIYRSSRTSPGAFFSQARGLIGDPHFTPENLKLLYLFSIADRVGVDHEELKRVDVTVDSRRDDDQVQTPTLEPYLKRLHEIYLKLMTLAEAHSNPEEAEAIIESWKYEESANNAALAQSMKEPMRNITGLKREEFAARPLVNAIDEHFRSFDIPLNPSQQQDELGKSRSLDEKEAKRFLFTQAEAMAKTIDSELTQDFDRLYDLAFRLYPASTLHRLKHRKCHQEIFSRMIFLKHLELLEKKNSPAILTRVKPSMQGSQPYVLITVGVGRDMMGLLYKITGVLAAHGFNIEAAEIQTDPSGLVLNHFFVFLENGKNSAATFKQINDALSFDMVAVIQHGIDIGTVFDAQAENDEFQVRGKFRPTKISFKGSEMEIETSDRRGLLYSISRTLNALGLDIRKGPIGTYLAGAKDKLEILDQDSVTGEWKPVSKDIQKGIHQILTPLLNNRRSYKNANVKKASIEAYQFRLQSARTELRAHAIKSLVIKGFSPQLLKVVKGEIVTWNPDQQKRPNISLVRYDDPHDVALAKITNEIQALKNIWSNVRKAIIEDYSLAVLEKIDSMVREAEGIIRATKTKSDAVLEMMSTKQEKRSAGKSVPEYLMMSGRELVAAVEAWWAGTDKRHQKDIQDILINKLIPELVERGEVVYVEGGVGGLEAEQVEQLIIERQRELLMIKLFDTILNLPYGLIDTDQPGIVTAELALSHARRGIFLDMIPDLLADIKKDQSAVQALKMRIEEVRRMIAGTERMLKRAQDRLAENPLDKNLQQSVNTALNNLEAFEEQEGYLEAALQYDTYDYLYGFSDTETVKLEKKREALKTHIKILEGMSPSYKSDPLFVDDFDNFVKHEVAKGRTLEYATAKFFYEQYKKFEGKEKEKDLAPASTIDFLMCYYDKVVYPPVKELKEKPIIVFAKKIRNESDYRRLQGHMQHHGRIEAVIAPKPDKPEFRPPHWFTFFKKKGVVAIPFADFESANLKFEDVPTGELAFADGKTGEMIIHPDSMSQAQWLDRGKIYRYLSQFFLSRSIFPVYFSDKIVRYLLDETDIKTITEEEGHPSRVYLSGAKGIGLLRLEEFFAGELDRPGIELDEDRIGLAIAEILSQKYFLDGKPLIVRLFDVAEDKRPNFLVSGTWQEDEIQTILKSMSSIRFYLKEEEKYRKFREFGKKQLRALYSAHVHQIINGAVSGLEILFSDVRNPEEVDQAEKLIEEAKLEFLSQIISNSALMKDVGLDEAKIKVLIDAIPVGYMFEKTKAVEEQAEAIFQTLQQYMSEKKVKRFAAVGANDLNKSILIDRMARKGSITELSPYFIRDLAQLASLGKKYDIPITLEGEWGSSIRMMSSLMVLRMIGLDILPVGVTERVPELLEYARNLQEADLTTPINQLKHPVELEVIPSFKALIEQAIAGEPQVTSKILNDAAYTVQKVIEERIINGKALREFIKEQEAARSELRLQPSVREIVKEVMNDTGNIQEKTIDFAVGIVRQKGWNAFEQAFRTELRLQMASPSESYVKTGTGLAAAKAQLSESLKRYENGSSRKSFTLGFLLSDKNGRTEMESLAKVLAQDASIANLIVAGRNPSLVEALKPLGRNIRPLNHLSRPLPGIDQKAVPILVSEDFAKNPFHPDYLPFWGRAVSDPFLREFLDTASLTAQIHLLHILDEKPELWNDRNELRAEMIRRLGMVANVAGLIEEQQVNGKFGFAVSLSVASQILKAAAQKEFLTSA